MSMFTRRHYVWLASVARDMVNDATEDDLHGVNVAITALAGALKSEAPDSFDRELFIRNIYNPQEAKLSLSAD